jgi:HAMP domain-containing protein
MTLIVLTVVVIALLIAVLAIFLFAIGTLLNRTADNLDDCAQNVKKIAYQAEVIGPGVVRINETGTTVLGALPLLCDGAESVAVAKGAPYVGPSEDSYSAPSSPSSAVTTSKASAVVPAASSRGVGYLDEDGARGNLGYLDA